MSGGVAGRARWRCGTWGGEAPACTMLVHTQELLAS